MSRLLLAAALLAPAAVFAQAPRPMTPEDVMGVRSVSDPQVSPDGRWIAYVVATTDTTENATDSDVWLVRADGGAPPRRLTTSRKSDGSPRWSPDGTRLAFVSAREERPQVFVLDPNGGEAERLTDSKTAVSGFAWSPDGKRIAYVASRAPTADEEKRQRMKDDAIVVDSVFAHTRLWVLDVADKKTRELVAGDFSVGDPQWSPDGAQLAYVVRPTPKADDGSKSDIFVVAAAGGTPRKLTENPGSDATPRWSPDGRTIAYLTRAGTSAEVGMLRLAAIPAAGGAPRPLAPDFEYQPNDIWWSKDGRTLRVEAPTRTTSNLFELPATGGTPRPLFAGQPWVGQSSFSDDWRTIAVVKSDLRTPPDVHVARAGARTLAKLTDHNPQVRSLAIGRTEVLRYRGPGGMEVEGLVIYPADYAPGKRYPLITQVHGGPAGAWLDRFPSNYGSYAHVWAGRGWVVFQPNPRGSTGYGEAFLRANIKDWGVGDYGDIQAGIDTLVGRGVADPARLAQAGWSYGGYMTAWTLTQTTRFKAVMVGAGLTNMESMYGTNDIPSTLDGYFGGTPYDNVEEYRKRSAMTYIKQAKTPTLILHGQQDLRVPTGQAQELYLGLKRQGVPVSLVFYPREGHGLGEPRHQLDKMRRELAWMTRYTTPDQKVMQE
ncbi:S9 family peptidase [Roseisolibacter sp. H3M3-2]|uniref:S9 family peptidase n=1 Tax=Roseisolibacter sp. H3M3-2 TaxID=3031323 RepID=UPI0023D9C7B3|nr:S9 family peptidase [Roseisolibacter sp. H3M3-2]MDF1502936.1 S9 family peptidase [Roseisolibacter sp. H3M3-2]